MRLVLCEQPLVCTQYGPVAAVVLPASEPLLFVAGGERPVYAFGWDLPLAFAAVAEGQVFAVQIDFAAPVFGQAFLLGHETSPYFWGRRAGEWAGFGHSRMN